MTARRAFVLSLIAFVLALVGCRKPEPPRITPKEVKVAAVGPAGLDVVLKVEAVNPNGFALSANRITGKATLDGKWEMGTVTIDRPFSLAPNAPTILEVPMKLPWSDLQALTALGAAPGPIPYVIDGKVTIGGERLNVDVPYAVTGTLTREQIGSAVLKGLPPNLGIPGLAPPPGR